MSGICALAFKDKRPAGISSVEAMLAPIREGLEGGTAVLAWKHVAVGAYDRFGRGATGMVHSDDDVIVAVDGEFYNHAKLAEALGGLGSGSGEAALVARLYAAKGLDWWKDVRGVFGVFLWDKRKDKGWAFSDRIGVRPLAYLDDGSRTAVATRIRSLAALPGFDRSVDPQAVYSYLHMEAIPVPWSIYKSVKRLESGHRLEIGTGAPKAEEVWRMSFPPEKIADENEIKDRIYSLLEDSVRHMGGYGAPLDQVGSFLSGGTDSSSIAGLFSKIFPGKAKTFSMGFDEAGYDEMEYSRIAVKAFGTDHHEYYVTPDDVLGALPGIAGAYDEPFGNSSAIPTYFCAKLAHDKGIKVMLGGDGGDEIFGGNSRYQYTFTHFSRFPSWLTDGIVAPLIGVIPASARVGLIRKAENYVRRAHAPLYEKIHGFSLSSYMDISKVFDPGFMGSRFVTPAEISKRYMEAAGTGSGLDQFLYNDLKLTLMDNDLPKVNRMTELAGIKVRFPFLDHPLVEFSGRIPPDMKVRGDRLRYVFKEAMRGLLPAEIIEKTKHGFGIPVVRWMLRPGKLNDFLKDVVFDPRVETRGFFRKGFVKELYRRSQDDKTPYFGTYLYYIMFLELWMRKHVDG